MTEGPLARDSESGLSTLPPEPNPVLGRSGKFKNPREPPIPGEVGPLTKSFHPKISYPTCKFVFTERFPVALFVLLKLSSFRTTSMRGLDSYYVAL